MKRPRFQSQKHKALKKHGDVLNYASKAMRAAEAFEHDSGPAETLEQLDTLLAKYEISDTTTFQPSPKTPKPTPAALKIIEDTTIEMEREKRSIERLLAQATTPGTPVGKREGDDFDLEAIERQLAEMEAAATSTKRDISKRHVGSVYGLKKQDSTKYRSKQVHRKSTQQRRRHKKNPEAARVGVGVSGEGGADAKIDTQERAMRVANARRNAVSLAQCRQTREQLREDAFLQKQSIVTTLEENRQLLETLEMSSLHHINDCSSENMFPLDHLNNNSSNVTETLFAKEAPLLPGGKVSKYAVNQTISIHGILKPNPSRKKNIDSAWRRKKKNNEKSERNPSKSKYAKPEYSKLQTHELAKKVRLQRRTLGI